MTDDGGQRPDALASTTDESSAHNEHVANFLRGNREEILASWEKAVRELPAAKAQKLGKLALRNSIPKLLLRIADMIESVTGVMPPTAKSVWRRWLLSVRLPDSRSTVDQSRPAARVWPLLFRLVWSR